jgi:hypothetical protein
VLFLSIMAAALQAEAAPTYAARFDCTVADGDEAPYHEFITVSHWQTGVEQPMIEMHLNDGRTITHPGMLYRAHKTANGGFSLSINSTAFVWVDRESGDTPIRYRSLYFFHHGGQIDTTGTCEMDLRTPIQDGAIPGWEGR